MSVTLKNWWYFKKNKNASKAGSLNKDDTMQLGTQCRSDKTTFMADQ